MSTETFIILEAVLLVVGWLVGAFLIRWVDAMVVAFRLEDARQLQLAKSQPYAQSQGPTDTESSPGSERFVLPATEETGSNPYQTPQAPIDGSASTVDIDINKPAPKIFQSPACECSTVWPFITLLGLGRRCRSCSKRRPAWFMLLPIVTALLFAGYAYALLIVETQFLAWSGTAHPIVEVRPFEFWMWGRLPYHLVLITLLIAATATDLREYIIPDEIVLPGIIFGVALATIAGDLQMMHLWVDWAHEQPGLSGPYIPQWIKDHHHLHGLAWSLAGMVAGAGITWLIRVISGLLLGAPAMGFGDVTFMAMIGCFLGWQPVVFVILFAPGCAIVFGMLIRIFTGRSFFAFGPYLAMGTGAVLLTWRWVWPATRDIFGHWPSLAMLFGISFGSLILLLGGLRIYRAIPVRK